MSLLPTPIRKVLRSDPDSAALERVWRGIQRRRAEKARRTAPVRWALPAVAVAVAFAAVFVVLGRRAGTPDSRTAATALHLAGGGEVVSMVSPASSSRAVDFSDGSRIELRAGARVEPIENSSRAFRVALAAGAATFDVRPGGPRRWAVECGRVSVEVVGTRFTVACAPAAVRVDVERGIVLVRGDGVPDGAKRLTAGMSLEVQDTPPVEIRPTLPDPEDAQPPLPRLAPTRVPAPAGPPSALPTPSAPWKSLALHGDNDSAYAELGPQGIASASETASVEDLLTLADVARLSGHPRDAVAPLSRIVSEHAQDPSAPLAAFTLGRIQLDSLAQPREAATSFQRAIDLGLPRSLEQDAYARRVEAKARAGDAAGAREARQEYERRFPQGQRLNEVRKWSHAD